jgi:hypothetical protein
MPMKRYKPGGLDTYIRRPDNLSRCRILPCDDPVDALPRISLQPDEKLQSGRGLPLLVLGQGRLSDAENFSELRLC